MRYRLLATDYDGTLATHGKVDDAVVAVLKRARSCDLRIVLVTGRELTSLFNTFDHADVFNLIVAENGAVLHNPSTSEVDILAGPPPPAFVEALERAQVPISLGHSIVASVIPFDHQMLGTIRSLGLDWQLIYNKRSVMAVPAGVTKATGLATAFSRLGVSPRETAAIGDAENDVEFMRLCGLSVAVSNALPVVKEMADVVLPLARGAGVSQLTMRLLADEFGTADSKTSAVTSTIRT